MSFRNTSSFVEPPTPITRRSTSKASNACGRIPPHNCTLGYSSTFTTQFLDLRYFLIEDGVDVGANGFRFPKSRPRSKLLKLERVVVSRRGASTLRMFHVG